MTHAKFHVDRTSLDKLGGRKLVFDHILFLLHYSLKKKEIYIVAEILFFDPRTLNLTLRLNELSYRNELDSTVGPLRLHFLSWRHFIAIRMLSRSVRRSVPLYFLCVLKLFEGRKVQI